MGELDICPRPVNIYPKEDVLGVMVQDMELGPKRSTTCTCSMLEKLLMALVEVDLGLVLALLHSIIQVIIVEHMVFIVMVITGVGIYITPANFLHITMVE